MNLLRSVVGGNSSRLPTLRSWRPTGPKATDSFWWWLAGEVYVHSHRANKAFGISSGTLHYSDDNSWSWARELAFVDALDVTFSHIFANGNILWATKTKLYLSTDNLQTYAEVIPQNSDGTTLTPHVPANAERPGLYFNTIQADISWDINGSEIVAWGSYNNVDGGAAPNHIWYSMDNGLTVKAAYAFGQNPYHRDDGTEAGGTTGTLLGDASNPVYCRHVHSVQYNPTENCWYACTGDHDHSGPEYECHWLKGTYDDTTDTWNWTLLTSQPQNTRYKSGGICFLDGTMYWSSDANGTNPDNGIYSCAPADLLTPAAHTLVFASQKSGKMLFHGGVFVTGIAPDVHGLTDATLITISTDYGVTWNTYDLGADLGERNPQRFHLPNNLGWFRCDMRVDEGWTPVEGGVMFFKLRD